MSQPLDSTDPNTQDLIRPELHYFSRTAVVCEGSYRARALIDLPSIPPEVEDGLLPLYRHIEQYIQSHPNLASAPIAFSYRHLTPTEHLPPPDPSIASSSFRPFPAPGEEITHPLNEGTLFDRRLHYLGALIDRHIERDPDLRPIEFTLVAHHIPDPADPNGTRVASDDRRPYRTSVERRPNPRISSDADRRPRRSSRSRSPAPRPPLSRANRSPPPINRSPSPVPTQPGSSPRYSPIPEPNAPTPDLSYDWVTNGDFVTLFNQRVAAGVAHTPPASYDELNRLRRDPRFPSLSRHQPNTRYNPFVDQLQTAVNRAWDWFVEHQSTRPPSPHTIPHRAFTIRNTVHPLLVAPRTSRALTVVDRFPNPPINPQHHRRDRRANNRDDPDFEFEANHRPYGARLGNTWTRSFTDPDCY